MPKQVDHEARRAAISDAVVRLLAQEGLEAVSLRNVAAEAGVSTGQVQHYFPSREAMMEFALRTIAGRVALRIEAAGPEADPRRLLAALLPTGPDELADARSLIGYLAFAAVRPSVAADIAANGVAFRDHLAGLLTAHGHHESTTAATGLIALVDGLGIHIAFGLITVTEAFTVLDTALDLLRPGS